MVEHIRFIARTADEMFINGRKAKIQSVARGIMIGAGQKGHHEEFTLQNGKKIDHTFVQRLYSAAELRDILIKECKFKSAEVYGGFNRIPYDQNLSTMVIVARK